MNAVNAARRQHNLLAWYARHRRELPWRVTADPYPILVSEFMLQQTQVARVVERFPRFMHRFPTVRHLSDAGPGAVIEEWQGLGYNRRAVALHSAAQRIVVEYDGHVPQAQVDLESLAGVGPYTARAIRTFAFSQRAAPVDVNIGRVLSRAVAGESLTRAAAQRLADAQLDLDGPAHTEPGTWSQALMDLGATHCRSRLPVCGTCPIRGDCSWQLSGANSDPAAIGVGRAQPQTNFAGSDRQHRGRLLDAVRAGPLRLADVPVAAQLRDDPARARRLADSLVRDGLVRYNSGLVLLP